MHHRDAYLTLFKSYVGKNTVDVSPFRVLPFVRKITVAVSRVCLVCFYAFAARRGELFATAGRICATYNRIL